MSSIFGMAWLDDRPLSTVQADGFAAGAASWGPDGVADWRGGHAMLGRALLHRTPEDAFDRMPDADRESEIIVSAAGRLDNRDDIAAALGVDEDEASALADSALIARAYRRWLDHTPRRLFGDWSFAAWHARDRRLFMARDQLGCTGLYFFHAHPFVAFASSLDALFSAPGVPRRINELSLAWYVLAAHGDMRVTKFDGIESVAPGHHMSIGAGGRVERRYWAPLDAPQVSRTSDRAYVDEFLERYRGAVRARLRAPGPIASALSSGLDSGSTTALAAEALGTSNRRLVALTSVPAYALDADRRSGGGDEGPLAAEVAARFANVDHLRVDARDVSPIAGVRRSLGALPFPLNSASNLYWLFAMMEAARDRGARVLLTGQLGNATVSWHGGRARILYRLLDAPFPHGVAALRASRTAADASWFRTVGRHVLGPWLSPARAWITASLRHGLKPWSAIAAIHPEFLRRMMDEGRLAGTAAGGGPRRPRPREERAYTLDLLAAAAGPLHHAWSAASRLDIRDPTSDVRLVEFCLGIPNDLFAAGGRERSMVKQAMRGLMPEAVLSNPHRGRQGSDFRARLVADAAEMDRVLDSFETPRTAGYLDVPALRAAWRAAQDDRNADGPDLGRIKLIRGVMAGLWIHQH